MRIVLEVLGVWVISIALLPLIRGPIEKMFLTGDLSLFWFMILAPPSYDSDAFIVIAGQATGMVGIGIWLAIRIMRNIMKDPSDKE